MGGGGIKISVHDDKAPKEWVSLFYFIVHFINSLVV